jgi:predicted transcriptional regulator
LIEPGQVANVRKRLGISQAELAKRSGVSQSLIAKIETEQADPAFSKAKAISDTLEEIQLLDGQTALKAKRAVEVMNTDILSLAPSDSAEIAIVSMARLRISQIPVMNGETVEGTLTDASLIDFVLRTRNDPDALKTPVHVLMENPLPQVGPETLEDDLLALLKTFPAVLVRDKLKIRGIVTKFDILSKGVTSLNTDKT